MGLLFALLFLGSIIGMVGGYLDPNIGGLGMLVAGIGTATRNRQRYDDRFRGENEPPFHVSNHFAPRTAKPSGLHRFRQVVLCFGMTLGLLGLLSWWLGDRERNSPEMVKQREEKRLEQDARTERRNQASDLYESAKAHLENALASDAGPEKKASELQTALAEVSEATKLDPQGPNLYLKAVVLGHLGQYDEGEQVFYRYLETGSTNYGFLELLIEKSREEQALAILDDLMKAKRPCDLARLRLTILLKLDRGYDALKQLNSMQSCLHGLEGDELKRQVEDAIKREEAKGRP